MKNEQECFICLIVSLEVRSWIDWNNKILHLLTNNTGQIITHPIALDEIEQARINDFKILIPDSVGTRFILENPW